MPALPTDRWKQSMLFSPLQVGTIRLRNRIVIAPMNTNLHMADQEARSYYRACARGGVSLVIVEITWLEEFEEPRFVRSLPALADAVHQEEAAIVIQLFHGGEIDGGQTEPSETAAAPAATREQLAGVPKRFAWAARIAEEAGFDGVELHGAHHFWLNRFFSPAHNRRRDQYGGAPEGRMRLGLECSRAVRSALSPSSLLLYRHTPTAEYPLDDTLTFAEELQRAGVNIIDISPSTTGWEIIDPRPTNAPASPNHADLAGAVKSVLTIPVIAVGGMAVPETAEAVLSQGKADLVAIGRALAADPDLPRKIKEGRADEIIPYVE